MTVILVGLGVGEGMNLYNIGQNVLAVNNENM